MKRFGILLGAAVLACGSTQIAHAGSIEYGLAEVLDTQPADQPLSVLVYMQDQVDVESLDLQLTAQRATRQDRHATVVGQLNAMADATQRDLLDTLADLHDAGDVIEYRSFRVANIINVVANPSVVEMIADRDDVAMVYLDYPIELIAPVQSKADGSVLTDRAPEPGVVAVRAPEVWDMGFTGAGILVSNLDTGVDGDHPALASRWAGVADPRYAGHPEWAWFDPYNYQNDFPYDNGGHGTHTMGSVCGGLPGDEVGVAPGAYWMAAAPIDRGGGVDQTVADVLESWDWIVDPDGDPNTVWDVPHTNSNSWGVTTGHGYPPCDELFWSYVDACEAAGIMIIFSAGNEGTGGLRRPSDRATTDYNVMAVAAVDANTAGWPIASFSSRGPTYCTPDETAAIKPDIAAPGVDVRSSVPGGGYSYYSGTSMASPHVNGVAALIFEACPDLSIEEVKEIIYQTAYDLGDPGEDNAYGWGMIDAYEAVNMALDWCGPSPPRVYDGYYETPVDTPVLVELRATDHDGGPEEISYKINTLPGSGHTLTDAGNDYVIQEGDLPYTLFDHGNEVIYTPVNSFYGEDSFEFLANDGGEPPYGGDSEIATVTILVLFDAPTIATTGVPQGYVDHYYGPFQLMAEQGQPPLVWDVISDIYVENDLGSSEFETVGTAQNWQSDDNSWSYTLPFAFPYFGEMQTSAWICSNGFIDFASSDDEYDNSTQELISNKRIAPMWDDLRTDEGGDIYIDESVPGQVTIRWDTVTYWDEDPCNHSLTLFEDGSMRFHYGSGNTPVSPTIGISKGDGTHYLLSMYDGDTDLNNANSVEILPPSPLPAGMMLNADGTLEGAPAEVVTMDLRVMVTDSLDRADLKTFELVINPEDMFGDVNRSGAVDIDDVFDTLAAWGPCDGCLEDVNADGMVDIDDIFAILSAWD